MTSNGDVAESLLTGQASLSAPRGGARAASKQHRGAGLAIFVVQAAQLAPSLQGSRVLRLGRARFPDHVARANPIRPAAISVPPTVCGYQVPLTQPPLIAAPPEPAVLHERVVAPPVRMIENVLPSVAAAVTV
jgi:hypothetical protein